MTVGRCFLCSAETSLVCPHCGDWVCGDQHYQYHRRLTAREAGDSPVPAGSELFPDKLCQPFKLIHGDKGRYLVATRDISPLETVLTDQPSVVGPPAVTAPVCLECLTPLCSVEAGVVECSLCSAPLCGRAECEGGPNHEAECRLLQGAGTRLHIKDYSATNIFYSAVLPLRMWSTRDRDSMLWAKINFLQEEKEDQLAGARMFTDVADYIHTRLGLTEIRTEEVLRLTGIKAVNAIDLSQVGVEGTALYGVYPLMNSYCYCNTMYHIDPATKVMKVRAKTAIKAGEEITTRYVVPSMEQPARLEHIWRVWGFICSCARCQSASELGSFYSGVKCGGCQAGTFLPSTSDRLGSDWTCGDCGASTSEENILNILARCRAIRDRLESQDPAQGEDLLTQLANYLHPNHGLCVEQKAKLVVNYSKLTDKPAAVLDRQLQLATDVIQVMDIIDPGLTPRRGGMLKYIVDIRMKKANKDKDDGLIDKVEHMRRMKSNMMLMKEMMMCLKYSVVLT